MIDFIELLFAILPFIFGLIAISIIPSKVKIINNQIKTYGVEKQIVVYMIGFFILAIGTYFFISSFFGEGIGDQRLIYVMNGAFLGIIGIGLMGLNYRNFSLLSEKGIGVEERIEVAEVTEVTEVELVDDIESVQTIKEQRAQLKDESQKVECPKCGNILKVISSKRPVMISCPKCGIEGMIQ